MNENRDKIDNYFVHVANYFVNVANYFVNVANYFVNVFCTLLIRGAKPPL